jgi:hypothetical protein
VTFHVAPIEALWFAINAVALALTALALVDAWRDVRAARCDDSPRHEARLAVAEGNVRREILRLLVHTLLISIVLPGLFIDRPITLTPALGALLLVPVVLLIQTALDVRERAAVAEKLLVLVRTERDVLALEASVQANIELTKTAVEKAEAAYSVANHSNEKLAVLTELVAGKEDKQP